MKYIIILSLVLTGCATTLTREAKSVRFVKTSPQNCKYIGFVEGYGFMPANRMPTLRNNAAKMGADTVELLDEKGATYAGEAYKCS